MTLLQLKTYCLDILDDPNGSYFTAANLTLRLNLGMIELQKRLISANKELFADCVKTDTVVGQQAYAMPTDLFQLIRLEYYQDGQSATTLSTPILPMTPNQKDLLGTVNGAPQTYTTMRNNFVLWPTPDAVYEIHCEYNYQVAPLVLDADVPDMDDIWHEYIAILTTRDCLIKDGRPIDPIKDKMARYEELLKQVSIQRQADRPRMVVQTESDGGGYVW